jgi:hypothetical protein
MKTIVGRGLAVTTVLAVALGAAAARADDGRRWRGPPVVIAGPPRDVITYEQKSPNSALIGSGALMLGISYGSSVVVAAASGRAGDENLYIPVAGPWMDLTSRGACEPYCLGNETANKVMLVTDGVFQGVGMLQILGGFLFPETRTVTRAAGVHVMPMGGKGTVGIAAYGAF